MKRVTIDRPEETEKLATELSEAGHRFEIETLGTGKISMTTEISDENGEEIVRSHRICDNGPAVLESVDYMIREAYEDWQRAGRTARE